MARHKTIDSSDENRAELYSMYIEPNHALVRSTVSRLTSRKNEIDDNFQGMCYILLRNIDTYNPEYKLCNWIITCCRREVGKFESNKPSYVDATKGGEFEYSTYHEEDKPKDKRSYKNKWRLKKTKDFVNVYDDSIFKSDPNEMVHDGVGERMMKILKFLSPDTNFGTGTYKDILEGVRVSGDVDISIHFMKYYYSEKVKDIAHNLSMSESAVKNALSRAKTRLDNILENL